MWNRTRATELLKIKYPIIQGPFGGKFSSSRMVAKVSNLGGMGSFGLNAYSAEGIVEVDKEIKGLTNKPYALNLWVPLKDDPIETYKTKNFDQLKKVFSPYFEQMQVSLPEKPHPKTQNFEQQMEAVLKSGPPVASFIFGIPSREIILELKKRQIIIMATATTLEEAMIIQEAGINIVIASGSEAGGHRASFMKPAEESLTCTRLLIHQVIDNLDIPVIAAGGISNGSDLADILKSGAAGAQIGTAFLATDESNASATHKSKLLSSNLLETVLTNVFTGRLARVISSDFSRNFKDSDKKYIAPYPIQSSFMSPLRKASIEQTTSDFIAHWSGQPSSILTHKSTESLFHCLIEDVSKIHKTKSW